MVNTRYVLVASARNEEDYIEETIKSVISQTILPKVWIIVSDGSTDYTDDIVSQYSKKYDFIQLVHLDSNRDRDFSSKVYAIQTGIEKLRGIEYDFIGNLDSDVSFEPDYYERVLTKFQENPKLGIAGGVLFEPCGGKWVRQYTSDSWTVSGAIQMFRRECFKDIGGYIPLKKGGEDTIAEVMTRMHGWEVKTFPTITVLHHRRIGAGEANILSTRFHQGHKEYSCGYHPLFEIARCIARVREKPYLFGSLLRLGGYGYASLRREPRSIPRDIISYLRQEQMGRLISLLQWKKSKKGNSSV